MPTFPKLAFTCPMKWDDLRGDERERFCAKCNRHVVNLSVLTEAERVALLASTNGERLCVAYYQRPSRVAAPSAAPARGATTRTLLRWSTAAAFVGALATVANQAAQDRAVVLAAPPSMTDVYCTMRYKVEGWVDDVRVYFGGTPRYAPMVLGDVCLPPSRVPPPPPNPASSLPSPSSDGSPSEGPG